MPEPVSSPPTIAGAQHTVCLEEMEGRWIAHVTTLPGCFSTGDNRVAAELGVPQAIRRYLDWRAARGDSAGGDPADAIVVAEMVREWESPLRPGYIVNAFFAADAIPLGTTGVELALRLLDWQRADLLAAVNGLKPEDLTRAAPDEWSMERVLEHVGAAEWWYLDRLGLACSRDEVPGDWRARLTHVRSGLQEALPQLAGVEQVVWRTAEIWSPRKLVRRALWHERDHTDHLLRLRAKTAP